MLLRILGSAAGGGFPQWNCYCGNCRAARAGDPRARPRSQSSLAVRAAGGPWFLVNASPDLRQQIESLHEEPQRAPRASPIAGVLLTDGEVDHAAGLILLRESSEPVRVYGTDAIRRALTEGYSVLPTLDAYAGVDWTPIEPGQRLTLTPAGAPPLEVEVFEVPGHPPNYFRAAAAEQKGFVVGFTFRDAATGGVVTYAPALGGLSPELLARFESSDCILVDGTFWRDDELLALGAGTRTARAMGHLPLSGPGGLIEWLGGLRRPRKILVHINNTNPILIEGAPERRSVEAAGVEVAHDGMTIEL